MANNLRKFATESEYNSATLNYPSVSWITGTDTVHFDKVSPIPPKKLKLTYINSSTYDIDCDTATTLTSSDVSGGTNPISAITSAEIGDCISSIGYYAFFNCRSLTSIDIPSGVTSIGKSSFSNCTSLSSVTIPNCVTSIEQNAFSCCSSLASIEIPSGVTSIGLGAFNSCSGLTSIDIPDSVTSISGSAFANCSGLTSCTIGDGVTYIGNEAFFNCSSLTSVTVNALTPPTLRNNVFGNTNDCPIYVPAASVEAYKAATNWSSYASRIQAIIE